MKQNYKIHTKETTIRVLNTEVSAVRKKDIIKKASRVIENDIIGIAGSIGNGDETKMFEEAKNNLSINIPYPYKLEEPRQEGIVIKENTITHDNILSHVETVLDFLKTEYPEFDFSETAKIQDVITEFSDSNGTKLTYEDSHVEVGFILKDKALANLFDGYIGYEGRKFDTMKFIDHNRKILNAYKNKLEMPEENELPVMVVDHSVFHGKLLMELNGEKLGAGSSLFSNKQGEKLFNDKVTVYQDYNPRTAFRPFFDMEGVVNDNYEYTFVEKGIFKTGFTNKKVAKDYNIPQTGSASGAFDDVPALGMTNLSIKVDTANLSDHVKKGIMVVIAAGGDYTPDGTYATPVQKAFLYEDGEIRGCLPEFQLKSHLYDMLGKDYIGTFKSPFYMGDDQVITVCKMTIDK
ncbi:MAG: hypothetical protein JEZ08_18425 [Clostridiales bacterium]|nr:hypothetical protein [Clostridiales bacterium]